MDVRRLHSLIRHLPEDSALARELSSGWTVSNELAAVSVEIAHEHYRAYLAAHRVPRGRLPASLRIPRPGDTPMPMPRPVTRRRAATVAEVVAVISAGHRT